MGLGVLLARADRGWMREFCSTHDGGIMLRRTLPLMIGLPILLGTVIMPAGE
jgi:hypothetical protein